MLEKDVQKQILDYLTLRRVFHWRSNNTPVYDTQRGAFRRFVGLKGIPDIICLLPKGKTLLIECKSDKGKMSIEQRDFQIECCRLGHLYIVARSIEDIQAYV
jgi:hypothetical protein